MLSETTYMPRIADALLRDRLESTGAVLIRGPKWCGKTRTAEQAAASSIFMDDPDQRRGYIELADTKPSILLAGNTPRLLDEWQVAPVLWDAVRFAVDRRQKPGQFILTGSAVPADDAIFHTGTGRISRLTMRPMSLYESGESTGQVSLEALFRGTADGDALSNLTLEEIAFAIARGGWPESVRASQKDALRHAVDYVDAIIESDVSRVDEGIRDPMRIAALLRSIARNISQPASLNTLRSDTATGLEANVLSAQTVARYLTALQRIFVVDDLPAWSPALRSRTPIRSTPKRQFTDPSIALAAVGRSQEILLEDFEYFGFLFESMCIRDLRTYADALDGRVFYYRDKTDLEADAVIVLRDGRWGAIEIKLGTKSIDEGAAHLIKFSQRVDTGKMGAPSFLMVLTAGQYGYRRKDGVYITPVGCLKP